MPQLPAILTHIGTAIIWNILQASLVWLVYVLIKKSFPNRAALHYHAAFMAIVGIFFLFIFTAIHLIAVPNTMAVDAYISSKFSINRVQTFLEQGTAPVFAYTLNGIAIIYLITLLVQMLKWPFIFRQQNKLLANPVQQLQESLFHFFETQKKRLHVKKSVRIYMMQGIQSPMTIGFLKPIILLPVATLTHLSTPAIEAILLHELAHIRRNDYLTNLMAQLLQSFVCFNPFVKLLVKEMNHHRELCCDVYVLQQQYEPVLYAKTLLQLAQISQNSAMPFLSMPAVKQKGELLFRIQHILQVPHRSAFSVNNVFKWVSVSLYLSLGLLLIHAMPIQQPSIMLNVNMHLPSAKFLQPVGAINSYIEPVKVVAVNHKIKSQSNKVKPAIQTRNADVKPVVTSTANQLDVHDIMDQSLPINSLTQFTADNSPNNFSFIQAKNFLPSSNEKIDNNRFKIKKISAIKYHSNAGYQLYLIQSEKTDAHQMKPVGFIVLIKNGMDGIDGGIQQTIYWYWVPDELNAPLPFVCDIAIIANSVN
ncbi:M56 family metallopeptidase [Hydrotalea sp.]|uniref:M56 family metallopeptidase n=2 Tax=Hydrotalea sp. TaxID=2881279 RepID=UPI00263229FF|nr:M56 family metallopeptidase [Hydrotalea sp.]